MKNDAIYALVSLLTTLLPRLPEALLRAFGCALSLLSYCLLPSARRTAHANLARVFPAMTSPERARLARQTYSTLGGFLGEAIASLQTGRPAAKLRFAPGSRDVFAAGLAEGRGVVFVSAHLGPWEAVASSIVAHGLPLYVIARESYDPRLDRLYDRLRAPHGVRAIYRGRREAVLQIARALRSGALVGVPMDLRSRVPSCDVPFMGSLAPTAIGPARIALQTAAAVVAATAVRASTGEILISATRIRTDDLPAGRADRAGSTVELTTRINAELSRRILAWPEAWVWMHPRYELAREQTERHAQTS